MPTTAECFSQDTWSLMPTPCDLGGITSPLHLSFYVCEVGVTSLRVKGATDVMCES